MDRRQERLRAALDHLRAGRAREAAELAHPLAEGDADAGLLLGLALGMLGDADGAADLLAQSAAARPDQPHPVRTLADMLRRAGRGAEIAKHLVAALERRPDDPWVGIAVAEMLLDDGHHAAALDQVEEVLHLHPDFIPALNLRGGALALHGETEAAAATFRHAVALSPGAPAGWSNLGKAYAVLGKADEAEAAFAQAAALAPEDAQVGLNRAAALLRFGRFADGWAALEARHRFPGRTMPPGPRLPDVAVAAGRTVLLWHEEGYGDTLQFIRYAPLLALRGARVIAWVPEALRRLVAGVEGVSAAVGQRPETYDWHLPMISLPGLFGTGAGSIPSECYLRPDAALVASWRTRLSHLPGIRVGLAWAGGARPWDPAATVVDRARSTSLDALARLRDVPNIAWVSLQAGPRSQDAAPPGLDLHRPMQDSQDFADTAALIANLDAVLSVDTAVAHLAGGMGRPVLLLDRWDPCWRWMHGQDTSPWYPSMRILRQGRPGDWAHPVAAAAQRLVAMAASSGPRLPA